MHRHRGRRRAERGVCCAVGLRGGQRFGPRRRRAGHRTSARRLDLRRDVGHHGAIFLFALAVAVSASAAVSVPGAEHARHGRVSTAGTSTSRQADVVYVERNAAGPATNSILVYRYAGGEPKLIQRASTGGTGSADLTDSGVLDADQQVITNAAQTLLFAVNQGSDSIAVFHVRQGGLLRPVAGSPFSSAGPAPASLGLIGDTLVVASKAQGRHPRPEQPAPQFDGLPRRLDRSPDAHLGVDRRASSRIVTDTRSDPPGSTPGVRHGRGRARSTP
jgi:hypothetical protein